MYKENKEMEEFLIMLFIKKKEFNFVCIYLRE